MKYKQVTSDEWADFCSSFRTYVTEGRDGEDGHSIMYDKLARGPMAGEIIGIVRYHHAGSTTYEIWDMAGNDLVTWLNSFKE